MTHLEIERQFLLKSVPSEILGQTGTLITQGYFLAQAVPDAEIRIRQKGDDFFLTIKGSGLMTRSETEISLSKEQFFALWPLTEGRRIEKVRRIMTIGPLKVEIDEHRGKLAGLVVAEVEFKDEISASTFKPPEWFGEELTQLSALKNGNLARHGLPKEYQYLLR